MLTTAAAQSSEAVVQQPYDIGIAEKMVGLPAPAVFFSLTGRVCSKPRHTSARDYEIS